MWCKFPSLSCAIYQEYEGGRKIMGKIMTAHFLTIFLFTVMVNSLFFKNKNVDHFNNLQWFSSRFKVNKETLKPVQLEAQKLLEPFLIFPSLTGNIFWLVLRLYRNIFIYLCKTNSVNSVNNIWQNKIGQCLCLDIVKIIWVKPASSEFFLIAKRLS